MKDFDTQIVITSVMRFKSKKDKEMVKLDLLFTDSKICNCNDKFVGCTPVTQWYYGYGVFDDILKNDLILKVCTGHFVSKQDFKDPTKYTSRLESIKYKDNFITLLQSDN